MEAFGLSSPLAQTQRVRCAIFGPEPYQKKLEAITTAPRPTKKKNRIQRSISNVYSISYIRSYIYISYLCIVVVLWLFNINYNSEDHGRNYHRGGVNCPP